MPSILIVDDEPNILTSLSGALGREGYQVETAATLAAARERIREAYDVVLLDVWLPDGSGLDLLAEIGTGAPETTVVMMSGHATLEAAVRATKLGAYDFLEKPIGLERVLVVLENAGSARALAAENQRLREAFSQPIVGRSRAVQTLRAEIGRIGPSPATVLIQGESGTGKELVARALHAASPRRAMPFVAVNGAAIPEELIESELFGHEKGAFTGATQARRGRFEEAHRGTLFLDEVADLSARAQTKLLRVIEERELQRVGGQRTIRVDVRLIAASHRDLEALVKDGGFREDLFFRIAVVPIVVPPLRERHDDVPLLVEHLAARAARDSGLPRRRFSRAALERLSAHPFPGNVRELRNLVERLILMSDAAEIGPDAVAAVLPAVRETAPPSGRLADLVRAHERGLIEAALRAAGGNVTQAALQLGLERSHLYKKMRALGLQSSN